MAKRQRSQNETVANLPQTTSLGVQSHPKHWVSYTENVAVFGLSAGNDYDLPTKSRLPRKA